MATDTDPTAESVSNMALYRRSVNMCICVYVEQLTIFGVRRSSGKLAVRVKVTLGFKLVGIRSLLELRAKRYDFEVG